MLLTDLLFRSNGAWFCVGERGGGGHIVLIEMQCY